MRVSFSLKNRPTDRPSSTESQAEQMVQSLRPSWQRRALRYSTFGLVGLISSFLLLMIAVLIFLTPARLTPFVNKMATEYLDGSVHFDTVDFSWFKDFPRMQVVLKNGEVISHALHHEPDSVRSAIPAYADTLLQFQELRVSFDAMKLLANKVSIGRLHVIEPQVNAYIASSGKANWDILKLDSTASTTSDDPFEFRFRRIELQGAGTIRYESAQDSLKSEIDLDHLTIRRKKGTDYEYALDFQTDASLQMGELAYIKKLPIFLKGECVWDWKVPEEVTLRQFQVGLDSLRASFDGEADFGGDSIDLKFNCKIDSLMLQRVVHLIPAELFPLAQSIRTDISLDFDLAVQGAYNPVHNRFPSFVMACKIDGGHLYSDSIKARLDNLIVDASVYYNYNDSTGVRVHQFELEGSGLRIKGSGTAWNVLEDPAVKGRFTGSVDLGVLSSKFPPVRGMTLRGRMGVDAQADFRMSQLNLSKIGEAKIKSRLTLNNVWINMPMDSIELLAQRSVIDLNLNANLLEEDSLIQKGTKMISARLTSDSLNVVYQNQIHVAGSGIRFNIRNAASFLTFDTTRVHPVVGDLEANYIKIDGLDSTWIAANDVTSAFRVLPAPENPAIPKVFFTMGVANLFVREQLNHYRLNGSNVTLEATLNTQNMDREMRIIKRLDSLQMVYPDVPRDSLLAHSRKGRPRREKKQDEFAAQDLDFSLSDNSIRNLLRRWNAKGSVYAISGVVATPYFPLENSMKNVDIDFTTDDVELKGMTIYSGESDIGVTGKIYNIRQALLGRGNLKVDASIRSKHFNFNELIRAANAGVAFAEQSHQLQAQLVQATNTQEIQGVLQEANLDPSEQSDLVVIPANLELNARMDLAEAVFADINMSKFSGEFIIQERYLQIRDLNAETDVGSMKLTALYGTKSKHDIMTGFDVEMRKMQIKRLIALIPAVDTLLPMLRSFEGVVDCEMAATMALDTMMYPIISTLNAASRIHGENMVLLDGETFAEIAKQFKFRNRKRNIIEKISVEMLVRNSQIEIFPFMMEMDRYRAAVSGVQKLDMSFKYHISLLKSPIPFRMGIDISGTPDKYKYSIGRARYKNFNLPSYVEMIDTTRLNLRKSITDVFKRGVTAATLADIKVDTDLSIPEEFLATVQPLTTQDSVILHREGVLEMDSARLFQLEADSLAVAGKKPPKESSKKEESNKPRERRRSKREPQPQEEAIPVRTPEASEAEEPSTEG